MWYSKEMATIILILMSNEGIIKHCNLYQTLPAPSKRPWTQRGKSREFDPTYLNLRVDVVECMEPENHPFEMGFLKITRSLNLGYIHHPIIFQTWIFGLHVSTHVSFLGMLFRVSVSFLRISPFLIDLQSAHLTGKALQITVNICKYSNCHQHATSKIHTPTTNMETNQIIIFI